MYWKPEYGFLILTSTIVDYIAARQIYSTKSKNKKTFWLSFSLLINIGLLLFFKYIGFFTSNLKSFLSFLYLPSNFSEYDISLPIGISFYTFQTLSYTIDVYRDDFAPEMHFGKYALYVSFFPQLVAGPIERAHHLLPQFTKSLEIKPSLTINGIKRILWGLFKKIVIADRLALIVDQIYGQPHSQNGLSLVLGTYLFAFQIYCDFSGYCDIAIGSGQLFGIKLSNNFRRPYLATSIADFWRKWHITLTSWFRDYLYTSLGGNRTSPIKWYRNILVIFIISGLWHGAGWTYILWGSIHGLFYICGLATKEVREYLCKKVGLYHHDNLRRMIRVGITFNLVSFGWILFRAEDVKSLINILETITVDLLSFKVFLKQYNYNLFIMLETLGISKEELIFDLCLLSFFIFSEGFDWIDRYFYSEDPNHITIRELLLLNIMIVLLIFLGGIGGRAFIYFQF